MRSVFWDTYTDPPEPIAVMVVGSTNKGLCCVDFHCQEALSRGEDVPCRPESRTANESNRLALQQLREYLEGRRREFSLPLDLEGTAFQKRVWNTLTKIPYGQTRSYGDIAKTIESPLAARAVGMANKANPVPIVVPCHRVIRNDGSLGGYGGSGPDVNLKQWLLSLERSYSVRTLL